MPNIEINFAAEQAVFQYPSQVLAVGRERELIQAWQQDRNLEARNELVSHHVRFAAEFAKRYQNKYPDDWRDFAVEGSIAIVKAANTYKPEKGLRFATYIWPRVYEAVQVAAFRHESVVVAPCSDDHYRAYMHVKKCERALCKQGLPSTNEVLIASIAQALGVPKDTVVAFLGRKEGDKIVDAQTDKADRVIRNSMGFEPEASPYDELAGKQEQSWNEALIRSSMHCLSPIERYIFRACYLSDTVFEFKTIGAPLKISRQRVKQIADRALEKVYQDLTGTSKMAPEIIKIMDASGIKVRGEKPPNRIRPPVIRGSIQPAL